MIMIPKVYQPNTPAAERAGEGFAPPLDAVEKMGKYNAELAKAVKITALEGLHPLTKGARVSFASGKAKVTDGPYIEAKEVIGGFWLLEAKSKAEVLEWAQRCPAEPGDVLEIRQIFEMSDFAEPMQKAAGNPTAKAKLKKK